LKNSNAKRSGNSACSEISIQKFQRTGFETTF